MSELRGVLMRALLEVFDKRDGALHRSGPRWRVPLHEPVVLDLLDQVWP